MPNKPRKHNVKYYDLLEILSYIDDKVSNFKDTLWDYMCDGDYIENDTITIYPIDFQEFLEKDYISDNERKIIEEGVKVLFEEFPDIENREVNFKICW